MMVSFERLGPLDDYLALQRWCCLIFPAGISHGRKVIGLRCRNESCWSTSPVPYELNQPRVALAGGESNVEPRACSPRRKVMEPLCQPIRFLSHLYRLSVNLSHSSMLIRPQHLSVLRAALCFRRSEQAEFLGMPWIVARRKK